MRVLAALVLWSGCAGVGDEVVCTGVDTLATGEGYGCADAAECCAYDPAGELSGDCWYEVDGAPAPLACDGDNCVPARIVWVQDYCVIPKRAEPPARP